MSVEIVLAGRYRQGRLLKASPGSWLVDVGKWWSRRYPGVVDLAIRDRDHPPALDVTLHPSAEALVLEVAEPGTVVVTARTASAGAGYHREVCAALHALGREFDVEWQPSAADGYGDETGYFWTGDAAAVDATMLDWLRVLAGRMLELDEQEFERSMLAMPAHYSPMQPAASVYTQLGPRSREWMRRAATNPENAIDLFPWWHDELDALHYINRALCVMWMELRWRPPLDEDELKSLARVHQWLQQAYALDENAAGIPWREWAELLDLVPVDRRHSLRADSKVVAAVRERAASLPTDRPLVGYRRGPIRRRLGEWSLVIPGSFAEAVEDDGGWVAFGDERHVRLSTMTIRNDDGPVPAGELLEAAEWPAGEPLGLAAVDLVSEAVIVRDTERGQPVEYLHGRCAVDGELLLATVVFGDDPQWALETWRSLLYEPATEMAA